MSGNSRIKCEHKSTTHTYLVDGTIVGAHDETVLVHVQDQVLAHDGQSDQGDVGLPAHERTPDKIVRLAYMIVHTLLIHHS